MKFYVDKHRSERVLEVGDWVYLKLQPYIQISVAVRRSLKLSSRYYGLYQVLEKIGQVSYRLQLPAVALIHHVFHGSQLKKRIDNHCQPQLQPPMVGLLGQLLFEPVAILERRIVKRGNAAGVEVLVQSLQ